MITIPIEDLKKLNVTEIHVKNQDFMGFRTFKKFPFTEVDTITAPLILKDKTYGGIQTLKVSGEQGMEFRGHVRLDKKYLAARTQSEYVRVGTATVRMTVLVLI